MYNQEQKSLEFDPSINHKIDMLCLAIIFVTMWGCLIRSDYNLLVIFFCYFIWQQRKDSLTIKMLAALIILFVFDLIFLFTQIRVWVTEDRGNPVWQTIRPMHNFAIFIFVLTNILKIVLTIFVGKANSEANKAVKNDS